MLGPGTILARRFEIVRLVAEGTRGSVYEAVQLDLRRPVAIKVLPRSLADDPGAMARFRREASVSARLQHPHVAMTTDFVCEPGEPAFLVMELVAGRSLGDELAIARGPLSQDRVVRIAIQILDGLAVAHAAGIVHRDLTPENVILSQSAGFPDYVRLIDFGIAKVLDEERTAQLTRTGTLLGTPEYMAPEQALGRAVDPRTDLYAVGVLLFRMATGRLPYAAHDPGAMLLAIVNDAPDLSPLGASPLLPIVRRVLDKEMSARFPSAESMRGAILGATHRGSVAMAAIDPASLPPAARQVTEAPTAPARAPIARAPAPAPSPVIHASATPAVAAPAPRRSLLLVLGAIGLVALGAGIAVAFGLMRPRPPDALAIAPIGVPPAIPAIPPAIPALPPAIVPPPEPPVVPVTAPPAAATDAAIPVVVDADIAFAPNPPPNPRQTPRPPRSLATPADSTPSHPRPERLQFSLTRRGSGATHVVGGSSTAVRLLPGLQGCMTTQGPPGLADGMLINVEVALDPNGRVTTVDLQSPDIDLGSPSLMLCLRSQYASMQVGLDPPGVSDGQLSLSANIHAH